MKLQTMPLKFRVWDDIEKKWGAIPSHHIGIGLDLLHGDTNQEDSRYIISQDTGLKDDEGQEIFERDILKNADGVGVVEYEAPYFQLRYNYKHTSRVIQGVIVGNLWQNPELLEEK